MTTFQESKANQVSTSDTIDPIEGLANAPHKDYTLTDTSLKIQDMEIEGGRRIKMWHMYW